MKKMVYLPNLIVFEGVDGCGKTTQARKLAERLQAEWLTQEPSHNVIGEFLRKEVLSGKKQLDTKTVARLFATDRAVHLSEIKDKTGFVVCDRYIVSNIVYQGVNDKELEDFVVEQNKDFEIPAVTFYLRVEPNDVPKLFQRIESRGAPEEIFDKVEVQQKLAQRFDDILLDKNKYYSKQVFVVNAMKGAKDIADEIWSFLRNLINGTDVVFKTNTCFEIL